MPHTWDPDALAPRAAAERLLAGNQRFCAGQPVLASRVFSAELAERPQRPFAIVLGCSDSRTPVEILFDEGFGDIFVVRIAGNVVAPSVVGSIEFAASQFGTRLVVVLGHTRCGAITATANAIDTGNGRGRSEGPDSVLLRELMRTNVRASVDHLRHGSRLIEELVLAGRVAVSAADYELETGRVQFFDGLPAE
jgi:carbonic anhydrase